MAITGEPLTHFCWNPLGSTRQSTFSTFNLCNLLRLSSRAFMHCLLDRVLPFLYPDVGFVHIHAQPSGVKCDDLTVSWTGGSWSFR